MNYVPMHSRDHVTPSKANSLFLTGSIRRGYGAIWDPYLQKDKDKLEKINRRAARFVANDYERQRHCNSRETGMAISRTTSSESTIVLMYY